MIEKWFYTGIVKKHFFNPRNILKTDKEAREYAKTADGVGQVGSPVCGDVMKVWIKVKNNHIADLKWQTFGCASAIASTSMMSVMVKENGGMKIEDALKIKPQDIVKRLGGLPARKIHCSVLGHKALKAALNDYFCKTGQNERIVQNEKHTC
jgi:NifU-like protein involved in Fe-S cluster formation